MDKKLRELLAKARASTPTPEASEEQRRSFAYGNTKIENDRITRASIDRAAELIAGDGSKG